MIFLFSAQPSSELPEFGSADRIIKKTGHILGYALLALSYWQVFQFKRGRQWLAWCFAIFYAATDEFHQSFVPGRSASVLDVLIFDNLGALISLCVFTIIKSKRSDTIDPIVENVSLKR